MTTGLQATKPRTVFSSRRVALMSGAAALGALLLFGAPILSPTKFPTFSTPAHAFTPPQQNGFADLVERAKPAVVSVRVKTSGGPETAGGLEKKTAATEQRKFSNSPPNNRNGNKSGVGNGRGGNDNDDRNGKGDNDDGPRSQDTPRNNPRDNPRNHPDNPNANVSLGSGFFISADGYVVTNNHVVERGVSVEITTDDGQVFPARVVGVDPATDLALLKVEGRTDFPFVAFAATTPRIGDWVIAIGNPFGLGGTVTAGIISANGRTLRNGPYDDFIQIDAPINKGNSGGPSFDMNGDVIGVNSMIYSPTGGSVGIGFAIPAATVKAVVEQLMAKGQVVRGWLGVQIKPVTAENAKGLGMRGPEGVVVTELPANSPAAKAGLRIGDVITAVNDLKIKDSRELVRRIGLTAPGTSVKITFARKGAEQSISVTLGEVPNPRQANADGNDEMPQLDRSAF